MRGFTNSPWTGSHLRRVLDKAVVEHLRSVDGRGDHLLLNLRRIAPFLQLLFHSRVLVRPVNLLMIVVLAEQRVSRLAPIASIIHQHLSNRLELNPRRVVYSQEL